VRTRSAAGQGELVDVVRPDTFIEIHALNAQVFDLGQALEPQSPD